MRCVNGGVQSSFDLFPYPLYATVRQQTDLFSDVAAFTPANSVVRFRVGDNPAASAQGKLVSSNYFSVLGVHPLFGRGFRADEESTPQPVVVVSYRFWQRQFAGDGRIVGRARGGRGR